jgi:hypothetical protein
MKEWEQQAQQERLTPSRVSTEGRSTSNEIPFDLGDTFQSVPNAGETAAPNSAGASLPQSTTKVTPFSDEEIVNFSATASLFVGSPITKTKLETEHEVTVYQTAFKHVFGPIMPTAAMIAPLKLGDALATYGIGKGMGPGFSLEQLPAWVRLTLGAVVLGGSSFMAFTAVKNEQAQTSASSVGRPASGDRSDQQSNRASENG